jgi:hypothetical protein
MSFGNDEWEHSLPPPRSNKMTEPTQDNKAIEAIAKAIRTQFGDSFDKRLDLASYILQTLTSLGYVKLAEQTPSYNMLPRRDGDIRLVDSNGFFQESEG